MYTAPACPAWDNTKKRALKKIQKAERHLNFTPHTPDQQSFRQYRRFRAVSKSENHGMAIKFTQDAKVFSSGRDEPASDRKQPDGRLYAAWAYFYRGTVRAAGGKAFASS
jgi:hypothetical protein